MNTGHIAHTEYRTLVLASQSIFVVAGPAVLVVENTTISNMISFDEIVGAIDGGLVRYGKTGDGSFVSDNRFASAWVGFFASNEGFIVTEGLAIERNTGVGVMFLAEQNSTILVDTLQLVDTESGLAVRRIATFAAIRYSTLSKLTTITLLYRTTELQWHLQRPAR